MQKYKLIGWSGITQYDYKKHEGIFYLKFPIIAEYDNGIFIFNWSDTSRGKPMIRCVKEHFFEFERADEPLEPFYSEVYKVPKC